MTAGRCRPIVPQVDRDGSVLAVLPPTWGGVTAPGVVPVVTAAAKRRSAECAVLHRACVHPAVATSHCRPSTVTRDLWHRFFEHQMQIDGGKNDGYAAWSDAGGLAMGHYDYSRSALYASGEGIRARR